MSEGAGLARLQSWMQAVITHPCCAKDGLASPDALRQYSEAELPSLVKSGRGLTAVERLGIYQGMHLPRMRDALAVEYPNLLALMGDEEFTELVRAYVQDVPSRSYTLNRLGDRLPAFLEGWGPQGRRALRSDLARLELAMTEVFDAEETASIGPEAMAAVPAEAWPQARLLPIAALRLVELSTNALAVLDALRSGDAVPPPRRHRRCAVVYRRDYAVRRRELSRPELALLRMLVAGRPLNEAVQSLERRHHRLDGATLSSWTGAWVAAGLFRAVVRGPHAA